MGEGDDDWRRRIGGGEKGECWLEEKKDTNKE